MVARHVGSWLGLCLVLWLPLAGKAVASVPEALRDPLALWWLDTGEPARALRWASSTPEGETIVARAQAAIGRQAEARHTLMNRLRHGALPETGRQALLDSLGGMPAVEQTSVLETLAKGTGVSAQEATYRLAIRDMADEAFDRAGRRLARMPDGYWAALGYLNLGIAYGRVDRAPSRSLIALRVALSMLNGAEGTSGAADLRQRTLMTAGLMALRSDQPEKAAGFLEQVSLRDYRSPQALWLHGLTHARRDNQRAAMQSWHRARKFPLAFPGAAEAMLGMGRAYDASGYPGQAGEAYLKAISAFRGEQVTLEELIGEVRSDEAYNALVGTVGGEDVEWFLEDTKGLARPRLAYLLRYLESGEHQQRVRRVREGRRIRQSLESRKETLQTFRTMLEDRLEQVLQRQGSDRMTRIRKRIETLSRRVQEARQTLEDAVANGRSRVVVSGALARKLATVERMKSAGDLPEQATRRIRRLEGVLEWRAQEQFELSSRALEKALSSVEQSLAAARDSEAAFTRRLDRAPARFEALLKRVNEAATRVDHLLGQADELVERAESALDSDLIAFLGDQTVRMAETLDASEQQIARIYEDLAIRNHQQNSGEAE
ncbi:hypothetical protein CF392_02425 [Tamilnaduibacter salinus]|uniref:Tetratricopeptide repeat protein n=1 Tax=Tamilnaduibacter salinus TaxID=1484056 RepID=A0A2A2I7J7_9GAMM|nr:hypothetical protein [Tamilnaduibacter salinus]PAV27013.1 hypothetical protein CF392_02425 [Tamilnaduibacter salinus]